MGRLRSAYERNTYNIAEALLVKSVKVEMQLYFEGFKGPSSRET